MIKYNPKSWVSLLFWFHKSDTFRTLLPFTLFIALYSAIIAYVEIEVWHLKYFSTGTMHTLLGFVISLLLVFRTNTAYERWWEGRKAWGSLVNASRNFALKMNSFLAQDDVENREHFATLISQFGNSLKTHLRINNPKTDTDKHIPNEIAASIISKTNELYKRGTITGEQLFMLNNDYTAFTDVCGICERIRKTPIPFSYGLFLKKFVFLYTITMPFAFAKECGYAIVIAVSLTFYVLASLEIIAEEIEDPFGTDSNDLPTDEIAETIKQNVYAILLPNP